MEAAEAAFDESGLKQRRFHVQPRPESRQK
jgi:hypothetical protein